MSMVIFHAGDSHYCCKFFLTLGQSSKQQRLLAHLDDLLNHKAASTPSGRPTVDAHHEDDIVDVETMVITDSEETGDCEHPVPQRIRHNHFFSGWKSVIPTIVRPYMQYLSETLGKPLAPQVSSLSACSQNCDQRLTNITCLYFDSFASIPVWWCECITLPQLLLRNGLFPTAPSQPRMAVSVELLGFYRALFERSCDAINALASALHVQYTRRGFHVTKKDGSTILEPFRRSLGHAIQWYDILQVEIEKNVEAILQECRDTAASARSHREQPSPSSLPLSPTKQTLSQGSCAHVLVQRCPACFGGQNFGRLLDHGGDIHVAMDGNFHHRHRRSVGNCPPFYDPVYFLAKSQVDEIGRRIDTARKRPARECNMPVPDEAVDQCETSYEAADGKKQKAAMDSFDDTGIMALICRHDIPLFFANIDTPGEQQKYSVALIDHLFSLIPLEANVVILYDVGCVLARSLMKYDILSPNLISRIRFATTAMHAYGHEWACQLVYNPRLIKGLGLSDGEGTERLWSRFIRLIGIERSSSRQRRIWLIDRHAASVANEMVNDLGDWLRRRLKRGIQEQGSAAQEVLDHCEHDVPELWKQWSDQRAAQLSIRAHAPARLRKELDTVLTLQTELDSSERALQGVRAVVEKGPASQGALDALASS